MTTDQPPPNGEVPELTGFEKKLLGTVVIGALGVGSLGLYSSYDAVSAAAENWGFDPAWILPVALDTAIPVFSLGYLLLVRFEMALAWVRFLPWALTLVTVYLNVVAAGDDRAAQVGHGALPLLWVACSEIAAHVYRVLIGQATGKRMERVRRSRWFLSPVTTFVLWRRMILWEVKTYRTGLAIERKRQLARADLRDRYGRSWRRRVSARQRALLRLGELAPVELATEDLSTTGDELSATAELAPVPAVASFPGPRPVLSPVVDPGDNNALTCNSVDGDELATVQKVPAFTRQVEMFPSEPEMAAAGDDSDIAPTGEAVDSSEEAPHGSGANNDPALAGAGDTSEEAGDSSERAGDTSNTDTGTGDRTDLGDNGSGDSNDAPRTGGKRRKRRPMEEWVELATPVYDEELRNRRKQPSGREFADAIELAGYGSVSESTAKNIRTAILDEKARRMATASR